MCDKTVSMLSFSFLSLAVPWNTISEEKYNKFKKRQTKLVELQSGELMVGKLGEAASAIQRP